MLFKDFALGNSMMYGIDTDPKPHEDDYAICDRCTEQNHIDDVVDVDDELICRWCFQKSENEFLCNNKTCTVNEFRFTGIAVVCPVCGTTDICHNTALATTWIHEEQKKNARTELATVLSFKAS